MKIVAFLQNMWVRDPERLHRNIQKYGEKYRRKIIEYALFAGCLTGKRLRKALGELCDKIVWEESSREIGGFAASKFEPDCDHIAKVLAEENPHLVLCFSKAAERAVRNLSKVPVLCGPHPANRRKDTVLRLMQIREEIVHFQNGHGPS